jgi:hypothetical protein
VLQFRRIWIIFAQMFIFSVVGLLNWKSYLNEREKCYWRQIYAFNLNEIVKECVIYTYTSKI